MIFQKPCNKARHEPDERDAFFDEALSDAMEQIRKNEYSAKFRGGDKIVYHAAFAFFGRGDI